MPRPESLFQIFGIILILLTSISVISFTTRFLFGSEKAKGTEPARLIYDPDLDLNLTLICPFEGKPYRVRIERTVCFNKTLYYWYIPWMRFDVWRDFREIHEERKRRMARELEMREREESNGNDTKPENSTDETVFVDEASLNRKVKEEPSKVVCTILAAFLILSSVVAFCDAVKEKCLSKSKRTQGTGSCANAVNKTGQVSTGERKEAFLLTAKVTQTLVHQSSLDRALTRLSSEVKPTVPRRYSVSSQSIDFGVSPVEVTSPFQESANVKQVIGHSQEGLDVRRRSRASLRETTVYQEEGRVRTCIKRKRCTGALNENYDPYMTVPPGKMETCTFFDAYSN